MALRKDNTLLHTLPPRIFDITSCLRAIRFGWIACILSGALTLFFIFASVLTESASAFFGGMFTLFALVDVAILLALAAFIYRKSRIAAILALVYYLINRYIMGCMPTSLFNAAVMVYFLVSYISAIRGTFLWHKEYKPSTKQE
ncbi:hypothetical protein FJU30_14830 [Affinibrenneria salicis]|uniref:Uncharacterized protein n=1 Tax=Affinibrenneria salicis TaxID=2590031 RepID=A0A5J5G058_9GAMM|nr:hypothetical protein [Affinibrenneria salicis]KAA8998951.1 hypothetical protein FJU30_14830 [Affinibrenneria salicis]